jgi:FtsP/CotA-like multicopper oxidase with cupredoxin domain
MAFDRRQILQGFAVTGLACATAGSALGARSTPPALLPARPELPPGLIHDWHFVAKERSARLRGVEGPVTPVWTYDSDLMPVRRIALGDTIRARLENRLTEHTSIHWHGVRVPNDMDGVPYLTQNPVLPGESFTYTIAPPDPGTFFIHPHCDESGQTGRGMSGVLIVEGDERRRADGDIVLACRDWRLADDGTWLAFDTPEGASRAGTFGTVRSVNGVAPLSHAVAAEGDIRLRVLNLDSTRHMEVGIEGADAAVIAIDGHAVSPFRLDTWRMGPAMRLDVLVRAPQSGARFTLVDYFSTEPWVIATFDSAGPRRRARPFDPAILYRPDLPRFDPANAERLSFTFSAASGSIADATAKLQLDDGLAKILMDGLCIRDNAFWAINKTSWTAGPMHDLPPPLALLRAGRSYVFELMNATPHPHPLHLHGHTFEVLSASRLQRPRHFADTVLVQPKERVEIGFVATKGDWMFHCHVLEHQEYGMMGYVRVAA